MKKIFLLPLAFCLLLSSCLVITPPPKEAQGPLYENEEVGAYWELYVMNKEASLLCAATDLNQTLHQSSPRLGFSFDQERIDEVCAILQEIEAHLTEKTADASAWIPDSRPIHGKTLTLLRKDPHAAPATPGSAGAVNFSNLLDSGALPSVGNGARQPSLQLYSGGIVIVMPEGDSTVLHYFRSDEDLTPQIERIAALLSETELPA